MRILIFNGGYLTRVPSGGDRHLLALAAALARRPEVQSVAICGPGWIRDWLPADSAEVEVLSYQAAPARSTLAVVAAYGRRALLAIWRAIGGRPALREAEVVLASPSLVDLLPAFVHRWRCGSRVGVFAFHLGDARAAGDLGRPLRARLARLASAPERALLRLADRVFTSATDVAEQLAALGVTRARIVRRPPIVDVAAIRAATPRSAPDILFVGRLVARKGVFDLIEAASGLRTETGLEATVGLVGEGEEADALRRAIAAARLEGRVKLLGGVDDDTLYGLMRGARVLVLPSFEEGYGLVIAEALVAGAAVVAYALPHYDEAFGDAIVQTSPGDIAALRSALQRALHAPRDIERASAVAALRLETPERAARAVIATFAQPGVSSAGSGGPSSLSRSGSESGTSRR